MDPREQLICGETKRDRREELERWRLFYKVALVRMKHVGDAGADRIKSLKRADERPRQKNLYLDATPGRDLDCLREAKSTWVKAGAGRPVGHHLQLSYSLRNRGRREAQGCTGN